MKNLINIFLLCVSFLSCDILRDGFFEVKSWTPGEGFYDSSAVQTVTLEFTLEPDKNSVERSFSLSEEGQTIAGHFTWQGRRMIFTPAAPLVPNRDYSVILKTEAHDNKGLSLDKQFEKVFTTRDGGTRPFLISTVPEENGIIEEKRGVVTLVFSVPLLRNSLQNLSFTPSISGVWALNDGESEAYFTPSEDWANDRAYRLVIPSSLLSIKEMEAGRSNTLHFSVGTDHEPPELLAVSALNTDGDAAFTLAVIKTNAVNGAPSGDEAAVENSGWEKEYRICFVFSEPVDGASVASALSCDPSLGFISETPPGYSDTWCFRFSPPPVYGELYTVSLRQTVRDGSGNTMEKNVRIYIRADGEYSKPPVLRGMRFLKKRGLPVEPVVSDDEPLDDDPIDQNDEPLTLPDELITFSPDVLFANFPVDSGYYLFDKAVDTWIELYFETATGASVDLISLMEKFKCNVTNGAITFSPRLVRDKDFSVEEPSPGWEDYCRVEIRGVLTNHPYMGTVTFEVGAGLKDNEGNKSAEASRILLNISGENR
jgi:hypothetical protein